MNKKITFLFVFFLASVFVRGQVKVYEYHSEDFNEAKITEILEASKQKGTKDWEIQKLKEHLYKRLENQKTYVSSGNNLRTIGTPPEPMAANGPCTNIGFENNTTSGWTLTSGDINSTTLPCNTCASNAGGIAAVTTAGTSGATWAAGVDNCSGQPVVAPGTGNTHSLLLNDASAGGKMQEIKQTFLVSTSNNIFTYQYLAVLEDGGHAATDQPYFFSQVTDASNNPIPCTKVLQSASSAITGWTASSACSGTNYKGWVTVTLDLTSYIGQNVTIDFLVSDCNQGGHYGYCYIDATCDQEATTNTVTICPGSTQLCGQSGYTTYAWTGPVTGNTMCLNTSTPGAYTLTCTGQCPAPIRYYNVTVSPTPTVNFSSVITPCNFTVPFTDLTTISGGATIAGWAWTFGDGGTSALQNPSHTYTGAGTYSVVLTCTSSVGCTNTYSTTVNLNSGPSASYTASTVCAGLSTVFTSTATGATGYGWNFGDPASGAANTDNTQNPTHVYSAAGSYVAVLTVSGTGTCSAVVTKTITVNPNPTASFTVNPVCKGTASVFNTTITNGNTYLWDYGNPVGPGVAGAAPSTHTYTTATGSPFAVTLTVTSAAGCTVTATGSAVVNPLPVASFSVAQVCQGTASVFNAGASTPAGSITSYTWNFGGAAPNTDVVTTSTDNHTYTGSNTAPGFPVTLTISAVGGCTATTTGNAIVNPMPVLNITTTPACDLSAVAITNNTPSQGTFTVWAWDMGDGIGTSAIPTPVSYTYPAPGIYTVTVNATTSTGCSGTATTTAVVHPNPDFNGQISQACMGDQSGMYDLSTITNPPGLNDALTTWNWNFGDGYAPTTAVDSALHVYANCGNYNVSYTVSTNFNCAVAATGTTTVFCLPVVTAPPSFSICPGTPVTTSEATFTTTCAAPALTTPHAFYFVNNPSLTTHTTSTHGGIPLADTAGLDNIAAYNAIAQNLSCGLLIDTVYGYAATPYLDANNQVQFGCVGNIATFTISVYPTPTVTPTSDISVCANQPVNVPNFTGCPTPETFTWSTSGDNVGLAATGAGNIASFTGLNATDIVATQVVAVTPLANGCSGPVSNFNIIVSPLPTMTVTTPAPYCPGDIVSSPAINTDPAGGVTLAWTTTNFTNIGMPQTGTGAPLPYTAPANGGAANQIGVVTYVPTLNGCVGAPATETITIKPTPVIQPIASQSLCPGMSTTLVNASIAPVPSATDAVVWTYPAGALPASVNGTAFPPIGPLVNPSLTTLSTPVTVTYTINSCAGLPTNFNIYVYPTPQPSFSTNSVCQGQATNFTDLSLPSTGSITVNQWAWDMNNDGIYNDATTQNPQYTLTTAGSNTVNLYVSTSSLPSCTYSISLPVWVNPNPIPDFVADTLSGCPTLPVVFRDTSTVAAPSVITSYAWNFGNGNSSNVQDPLPAQQYTNLSPTAVKSYTVSLTVTSTGGCTATMTKAHYINVSPRPIADFSWGPTDTDIDDPAITFVNQAIGAGPYVPVTYGQYGVHYYLGDIYAANQTSNYVDNNTTFQHVYDHYDPATYTVTQWVVNNLGCKDSITKEVVILPNFTFYIPNAFSPNGDGANEGFKGTGVGIDNKTYNLWVFDRWGNMLFYSDDLEKAWDGHMKGNADRPVLQEDVYVWKVNFHDFTGKRHDFHGTVTLIK
ncbi:MAG: PKD domain-containing protein [Bacteroidia bacterium]